MTIYSLFVVHGLAGGALSTWTHDNGACWLDWLAIQIPNLRIFVFGYPARAVYFKPEVGDSSDSGRVFTFAENLCVDINDVRTKVNCSGLH